ncbi:hypothetical protein J2794_006161 [Paraburkholderia terricola]|uniref:hypothetical protein n=1 Tax=Paraburkholderia terricola TaxID=169427 RepID=UPI002862DAD5|nr:hypothetical protein [Paraburkholderia terricola]MDR6450021.1 hypothetical protein [Paraburkholderia terricola]
MDATIDSAKQYLLEVELPEAGGLELVPEPGLLGTEENLLDESKTQAVVVGSSILWVASGVPVAWRESLANSLLLAQLVVKQQGVSPDDVKAWYAAYGKVLQHLGWLVKTTSVTKFEEGSNQFEVHEAIVAVAELALGGAPAALDIVKLVLTKLANPEKSRWITIFDRETKSSSASTFQLSWAEEKEGGLVASMMSFSLTGNSTLTQVLVFRGGDNSVTFSSSRSEAEINTTVLDAVSGELKKRVAKFTEDYISTLPDLK